MAHSRRPLRSSSADSAGKSGRQRLVLGLAIAAWLACAILTFSPPGSFGFQDVGRFATNSLLRLAIVLTCLWLAWPSFHKPLSWLPAGTAMILLVGIGAVAVQPRILPLMIPALLGALSLVWVIRLARQFLRG